MIEAEFLHKMEAGNHICQFYHRKQDLYEGTLQFIESGLQSGDYCLWITTHPLKLTDLTAKLTEDLEGFEDYLLSGQLELVDSRYWYFDVAGKLLAPDELLRNIRDKLEKVLQYGFKQGRGSGHIGRIQGHDWSEVMEYEMRIQESIKEYPLMAHCAHSLVYCPLSRLSDVIDCHDFSFYQKGDRWEILRST